MFELLSEKNENRFTWDLIGNIPEGRSNLGEGMPVLVYRLFQYTLKDELTARFGKEEAAHIFRRDVYKRQR